MEGRSEEQPLGRRERKKLEAEQRIRAAALELFREKGYEATTVEEIAERADVAKGTFFNYFPRKDGLLEALSDDLYEGAFEELGPPETWRGSARDRLLRLFLHLGDLVGRDRELSRVMMIENTRQFWLRTEPDRRELEFHGMVERVLADGASRGELSAEMDLPLAARLLEVAYFTTLIDWMRRELPLDVYRHELTVKIDIIFRGLGMQGAGANG